MPDVLVHEGNSARMDLIQDGEADVVITGPPYFTPTTEKKLRVPLRHQTEYEVVSREITAFAMTLRPVFEEIVRILKPGGFLVLQTRHLRYGPYLIPLTDLHADLALGAGLRMVTRVEWLAGVPKPERKPSFVKKPLRGCFRTYDTETFLSFVKGEPLLGLSVQALDISPEELVLPFWRTAPAAGRRHPHGSPPRVIQRFIELYSAPGELVVDPFCGYGTTLRVAVKLGRRAIGYDIDPACVRETEAAIT